MSSISSVCILGAGGHTRSLLNLLFDTDKYAILGIFDDSFDYKSNEIINDVKVLGKLSDMPQDCFIVLSYGDNYKRKNLFAQFAGRVLKDNLIHRSALIENYSSFGKANQIMANTVINTNTIIGDNNIINTGSIIEHEAEIGNHNHISVGSILCGRIIVGNECFIGAGTVIIDKLKICDHVTIGANSVVVKDIVEPGVYIGNPARKIK